jgi:(5-formylfuran-3-yl)methyl phosphate synthase
VTALLASVRTEEEAVLAVEAGADIIDLKDPNTGALGALPIDRITTIVKRVRNLSSAPLSATIGDLADGEVEETVRRVQTTAATGVDFVKVGIPRGLHAHETLAILGGLQASVVPLFLADAGLDFILIEAACAAGFPVVMVDTADKRAGSLFDFVPRNTLRRFVETVHAARARAGLAGSLRFDHVPALRELAPAIAGFRGALCEGSRSGRLVPERVRALRATLPAASASDLQMPVNSGV